MRIALVLAACLLLSGCQITGGRWVVDDVSRKCRGGVINTEKRITDTYITGRVRNTTIRTDACLD